MEVFGKLTDAQYELAKNAFDLGVQLFTKTDVERWREEHGLPASVAARIAEFLVDNTQFFDSEAPAGQYLEAVLVVEQFARAAGASLSLPTDLMGSLGLKELGVQRFVDEYCSYFAEKGRFPFALSSTEPRGGSDSRAIETTVKRIDGVPRLNGRKSFTNNGEFCSHLLISAIDEDARDRGAENLMSLWLTASDAKGVRAYPIKKMGQGILPFADVTFDNVELTEESNLMPASSDATKKLYRLFDIDRLLGCADCLGMAQGAMDDALAYATQREAFGRTIDGFQLVQEMIVRMQVNIENMRNIVYSAAYALDNNESHIDSCAEVALAKWYVPRTAVSVASDAMQIFGAAGYTSSERAFGIWEDCRGHQIAGGTDQIMVGVASRRIIKEHAKKE